MFKAKQLATKLTIPLNKSFFARNLSVSKNSDSIMNIRGSNAYEILYLLFYNVYRKSEASKKLYNEYKNNDELAGRIISRPGTYSFPNEMQIAKIVFQQKVDVIGIVPFHIDMSNKSAVDFSQYDEIHQTGKNGILTAKEVIQKYNNDFLHKKPFRQYPEAAVLIKGGNDTLRLEKAREIFSNNLSNYAKLYMTHDDSLLALAGNKKFIEDAQKSSFSQLKSITQLDNFTADFKMNALLKGPVFGQIDLDNPQNQEEQSIQSSPRF